MSNKPITERELFLETDELFDYWYADTFGINISFDKRAYQSMSLDDAKKVHDELTHIIEHCEKYEDSIDGL